MPTASSSEEPSQQPSGKDGMAEDQQDLVIGQVLRAGLLTAEEVHHAGRVAEKMGKDRTALSVLLESGRISQEQIFEELRRNRIRIPIGRLLIELGFIDVADLQVALELQKTSQSGEKLGEILVRRRVISERQFAEVYAVQVGCDYIEPDITKVDEQLLQKVTAQACVKGRFFPLQGDDDLTVLSCVDPLDEHMLMAAREVFRTEIQAVVGTSAAIQEAASALARQQKNQNNAEKRSAADNRTPIGLVDQIIQSAFREQASDIHIEPLKERVRVRFRCDGVLREVFTYDLEKHPTVTSRIKVLAEADVSEKRRHQDGRILYEDPKSGANFDMRASFYVTVDGEAIVLRLLNQSSNVPEIRNIGMPPAMLKRFRDNGLDVPSGVIIITGPTGSGKTTTLYSCVSYLNNESTSIITAEDPVEYLVDGISQCSLNAKLDVTYEESLRHIVRQDPDVIVLGEIRDQFSAESAIQAALTGHKVLTTFHTEDSIGGLLRLLNMDIEVFLISSTVVCVVAQRLIRKVCEDCAQPMQPSSSDLQLLGWRTEDCVGADFREGKGCKSCHFTGYRGRVAVFEALVLNEAVKEAMLNKQTSSQIRKISMESSGLVTLLEDGLVKAAEGTTTVREVMRHLPRLNKPRSLNELRRLSGSL